MSYDVTVVRAREFPWADRDRLAYMNHASTGPLSWRTVQATHAFTALRAEPAGLTDEKQFNVLQRSRDLCARLIGASPAEIALMVNTSYGVNLAARCLRLTAGDVVVLPEREFPANVYPWLALEKTGVRIQWVPCQGRLLDEEAFIRALDGPRVRAASVSWVSYETGMRANLGRLGGACRERGITFVVDAIQGLGALALDVRALPIDILACGAQKWLLSPWGTGFAYIRRELIQGLEPIDVGWMAVRGGHNFANFLDYDATLLDDARRYECGSLPFQDFAGFAASIELLLELGPAAVEAHVARLAGIITQWAESHPTIQLVTPVDPAARAGIIALVPRDPAEALARLRDGGVLASVREGAVRLSPHLYNTAEEMHLVVALLDKVG